SSKGFTGTHLEFCSFEVRGLVLYRPTAKHCSNNILQREHRSSKGFVGTDVDFSCINSFCPLASRLYLRLVMISSDNIIMYHLPSSKGFDVTQLITFPPAHPSFLALLMSPELSSRSTVLASEACCCTGQQPSIVAITYYNENIVAPRV